MGTTLADVIPTLPTRALTEPQRQQLIEGKRDIEALARLGVRHGYSQRNELLDRAHNKLLVDGAKLALEGHSLPEKTATAFDTITGKSTVRSARDLADRIGFGIFPWNLTRGPYRPPTDIAEALHPWATVAECGVYIMAPIKAYDLKERIEKPQYEKPIFVPTDARQAFLALGMSVPVFRSLQHQINDLRNQLDDYRNRLASIERDVTQLYERVQALSTEVAEARVRATQAEAAAAKALEAWFESVSDPLALILPPRATIADLDSPLLVGPSWGGDLPDALVRLVTAKKLRA